MQAKPDFRRAANSEPVDAWLWLSFGWLVVCLALGGGTRQGLPMESLLQLLALPMFGIGLYRIDWARLGTLAKWGLALFAAIGLWLFLQQIPLPPEIWTSFTGRHQIAEELQLAGLAIGWRPLSLDPEATRRAAVALLPPGAMMLLALGLHSRSREQLLWLMLMLILATIVLGLAQLAFGPQSALRWHAITNPSEAVGPFANRNHFAALLVIGLLLAGAWLLAGRGVHDPRRAARRFAAASAIALLLLGLALARSRAGVMLAAFAVVSLALLAWQARRYSSRGTGAGGHRRWLALAALAGVVLGIQFGFYGLLQRFERDPFEDLRWVITENTLQAAEQYGPLGSGAGTFDRVYPSVEPVSQMIVSYVNRAHNDWAEWWMEGGLPLAALLAGGLVLLAVATVRAFRLRGHWSPWPAAAGLGVWMLLLHSLADYPLRTTGLACVTAVLLAAVLGVRRT